MGERGREVNEFIQRDLGPEGLARSVVVVATSDEPALVRIRAAFTATRIAEWFRDQGKDVVLMMDSPDPLRHGPARGRALRGRAPATRGYPPSVFTLLPKLLERAGAAERGSITGLYTVLVEGDDMNEPIADAARSILDGHIVLSRRLATANHFPSIEVLESISRVEPAILDPEQRAMISEIRRLLAAYREAKDLIEIGAYVTGSNPLVDRAVRQKDQIDTFLDRTSPRSPTAVDSWAALSGVLAADDVLRGGAGMKRYHFALETVLRVRRAQEEAAGFALAHANRDLRARRARPPRGVGPLRVTPTRSWRTGSGLVPA